ncbi:ABC transporter permease [Terrarubrum flagellatum]|uniref:ABC transporter permease n=1 Tax=Terrirubrum flagellatum TaxID=2895980 RepID=UPI0031456A69
MLVYVLRRLSQSVAVLIGVTLITFLALHVGGDPTYLFVGERATPQDIEMARQALGFDKPLYVQYLNFAWKLVQGDMGQSLTYKSNALGVVVEHLPATIELTMAAFAFATIFAIPLGVFAALKRGTGIDGAVMTFAMIGQSMPSFWLGIMMIIFFGLFLNWLPISGHTPLLAPLLAGDLVTAIHNTPEALVHLIMPAATVGLFSLSRNARLIRSSMLEVLGLDFVRTARAKGQTEKGVVLNHALRNAWLPVITILGLEFGFMLSGVVVVETIFSWPGVGRLVFNAIGQRDIPVVQAAVVLFSFAFVAINLCVDMLYARLDPRVRLR